MRPFIVLLVMLIGAVSVTVSAQEAPASAPTPATSVQAPAAAASSDVPDRPDLERVRNFTRVYELIRRAYVKKLDHDQLMDAAIKGMLAELDPHSAFLDNKGMQHLKEEAEGEYAGLGVVVSSLHDKMVVVSPIDDTPASKAGIRSGDIIVQVDGDPVDPNDVQASIDKLRGDPGTDVTLVLKHGADAEPETKTLTRAMISRQTVHVRQQVPGYAYIRISQFQRHTGDQLADKLGDYIDEQGTPKGVILDLRSNPGGLVKAATQVADLFLDDGLIVRTQGRVEGSDESYRATSGDVLHGAPMVVLVNEGTASAAEIVSGALHDLQRAVLVGRQTFGKGVVQTVLPVDDSHALKLTTARYYTPSGTSIQAEGITPDIVVPDLVAKAGDHPPMLVRGEADLPHHLRNGQKQDGAPTASASSAQNEDPSSLAETDYALAQALNVLQGMAMSRSD